MAGIPFSCQQGSTGTLTATAPAVVGVTWSLTSLQISQAGGVVGPNAKVTVYDGAVGVGNVIFAAFLQAPGFGYGGGLPLGGSVGNIQDVPLPLTAAGQRSLQGTPGNAMNVQVTGTGGNAVIINARFADGLPPG